MPPARYSARSTWVESRHDACGPPERTQGPVRWPAGENGWNAVNRPTRYKLFGAVLVLVIAGSSPCNGQAEENPSSGNYMLRPCKDSLKSRSPGVWEGFCGGVIGTLMYVGHSLQGEARFCSPKGATRNEAMMIVVKYMESHPEELHQDFRYLSLVALTQAWPCQPFYAPRQKHAAARHDPP